MMTKLTATLIVAGMGLALSNVSGLDLPKVDVSKLPPASAKAGLTYDKDIKPIVQKSCVNCHGAEKPKGKYRVDSRPAFVKGGESENPAVVPGESTKSPVLIYASDLVKEMEMPPLDKREKNPALTKEQLGVIRAWIEQGAK
jgi:mono/diheme cytochrome c family protein